MAYNCLVVGMPRSGTSMTAGIFARAGYYLASDKATELRKGDEYNPDGYWEAAPLVKANIEILNASGFVPDNTWMYEPISAQAAARIPELERQPDHHQLVDEFNAHRPWIWKDPRLCYTLGYWWPLLDAATTRVLLLKRDPRQIYNSFIRLKWCKPNARDRRATFERIQTHWQMAEATIARYRIPHIEVYYDEFAKDADTTARRISEFFELRLAGRDLGFNPKANSSTLRGKISMGLDRLADAIPDNLRKSIKKRIPTRLFRLVFPFRH